MTTYLERQNDVQAFTGMLREGLPELVRTATNGTVWATGGSPLPARSRNENAFQLFLSNGLSYRVWVQQIGEAEIEEAGCQQCGELLPAHELDQHGRCPGCAQEQWDVLSAEEQAEWCRVHKQHYPCEDKGRISPERLEWIRGLLESHPWRLARTQPRNPRSYTLR